MRIERINDNQIRCTLSSYDLSMRNLNLRELAYGTEKARKLFHEMIQKASNEVGFEVEDIPLMVEAIPLSSEGVMLVITKIEDPEELDTRFSKFSPMTEEEPSGWSDLTSELLEGAEGLAKLLGGLFDEAVPVEEKSVLEGQAAQGTEETPEYAAAAQPPSMRVYSFTSLDRVSEAAAACGHLYNGINTLYKKPDTFQYYLVIKDDGSDPLAFSRVCNILAEYGTKVKHEYASEAYYREHYDVVCKGKALQVLGNI